MKLPDTSAILKQLDDYLARAQEREAIAETATRRYRARLDRPFPTSDEGIPIADIEADRKRIDAAYERFLLRYSEWMKAVH